MRLTAFLLLLTASTAVSTGAAQGPPDVFDVFVVTGQSNAQGSGDSTFSPPVEPGVAYLYEGGAFVPLLGDPVSGAHTGSAWPAFINVYHGVTGRGVILVGAAVGGSGASAVSNPSNHWGAGGGLFEDAAERGEAAYQAAVADGIAGRRGGWLWCQGERDADKIDDGLITRADYEAAMGDLLARYGATSFGRANAPFYVLRTGRRESGDTQGFRAVRAVQDTLPPPAVMAFTGAVTFPPRGMMENDVHWGQFGLNEAGAETATAVVAHPVAVEPAPLPRPGRALVVSPNPSVAGSPPVVTLSGPWDGPVRVELRDLLGRHVATVEGRAGGVRLPLLPAGRYVARATDGAHGAAFLFVVAGGQ